MLIAFLQISAVFIAPIFANENTSSLIYYRLMVPGYEVFRMLTFIWNLATGKEVLNISFLQNHIAIVMNEIKKFELWPEM